MPRLTEEQKIEKIKNIWEGLGNYTDGRCNIAINRLTDKINEIIDYLVDLKKRG